MNKYIITLFVLIICGGIFFLSQKNKDVWERKMVYLQDKKAGEEKVATSTVTLPRLENYPDKAIQDKVNAKIASIESGFDNPCIDPNADLNDLRQEWKDAEEYSEVDGYKPVGDVDHMSYEEIKNKFYKDALQVQSKIVKNSDDVFSIQMYVFVGCPHTAHPDVGDMSITFDLKTGEIVPIEDLFVNYKRDIRKILRVAYKDSPDFLKPIDGCSAVEGFFDENGKEGSEDLYFNYTLSGKDIVFNQDVPYAAQACAEPQSVPISKLKAYIKPNGILSRMIQ